MTLSFFKYQGTGNDFVIFDNRSGSLQLNAQQVQALCHRRFGIGADGLMLLNSLAGYDFEMKYFNSDGRESTMCGNGGRCLVKFAHDQGLVKTTYRFLAIDGPHEATIEHDGSVSLKMNDVASVRTMGRNFVLNTGSPHFVQLTSHVMELDVARKGKEIRYGKDYVKEGINVNFVEQLKDGNRILVRTYERGVEDETLSCGTGVTAAAIVCYHNDKGYNNVEVQTPGGLLSVEYEKEGESFTNIWLTGPAKLVFTGTIQV